ncbi:MAG TPA: hypothetical protein DCX89_01745 [Saprospirales bacterium]|nr:hypothetical protein [Saprospirales bacterium]
MLTLNQYKISFPYLYFNIFYIFASVHITRWIFFLKYSFFAHLTFLKIFTIFLSIAAFLYAYRGINIYQLFLDENGYYYLFDHLKLNLRYKLAYFVNAQYFFFGIWTMLCSLVFPIVLIRSISKVRNTGEE